MRSGSLIALNVLLLASSALAHGGSVRTPNPTTPTIVIPTNPEGAPEGPTTPGQPRSRGPRTRSGDAAPRHEWVLWWNQHLEKVLYERRRGRPITPFEKPRTDDPGAQSGGVSAAAETAIRRALDDRDGAVRAAAAIAMAKMELPDAAAVLLRRLTVREERHYKARHAALYALALLGRSEDRRDLLAIGSDRARPMIERSLPLVGPLCERNGDAADSLLIAMESRHSDAVGLPHLPPRSTEEERRRFAAHLLGFVAPEIDVNEPLRDAALGGKKSSDAVQAFAATALGRRAPGDAADFLFRLARSRRAQREVKRAAMVGLGLCIRPDDRPAIDRLAGMVEEDGNEVVYQHFGVMALGRIGGPHAIDRLEGLVRGKLFKDKADRAFLYLALGLCGGTDEGARSLLRKELERAGSSEERAPLAIALGLMRDHASVRIVLDHLEGTSIGGGRDFLAYGAFSLALFPDARGRAIFRDQLKRYADPLIKQQAALGYVLLADKEAIAPLVEMLRNDGNALARAAAANALGFLRRPYAEAVEALAETAADDSVEDSTRALAIGALGRLFDPREVPFSAQLVADVNYFVRCLALDEIATWL